MTKQEFPRRIVNSLEAGVTLFVHGEICVWSGRWHSSIIYCLVIRATLQLIGNKWSKDITILDRSCRNVFWSWCLFLLWAVSVLRGDGRSVGRLLIINQLLRSANAQWPAGTEHNDSYENESMDNAFRAFLFQESSTVRAFLEWVTFFARFPLLLCLSTETKNRCCPRPS